MIRRNTGDPPGAKRPWDEQSRRLPPQFGKDPRNIADEYHHAGEIVTRCNQDTGDKKNDYPLHFCIVNVGKQAERTRQGEFRPADLAGVISVFILVWSAVA